MIAAVSWIHSAGPYDARSSLLVYEASRLRAREKTMMLMMKEICVIAEEGEGESVRAGRQGVAKDSGSDVPK